MLALALFSLAPATVGSLPVLSDEDREIVVIGQKLKNWRGVFKQRKGEYICTTKRSTGDKMIDQIGCDALLKCAAPRGPEINAIFSANKDKKAREQLMKPINESIGACLVETRNDGIAALAEKRAAGVSK